MDEVYVLELRSKRLYTTRSNPRGSWRFEPVYRVVKKQPLVAEEEEEEEWDDDEDGALAALPVATLSNFMVVRPNMVPRAPTVAGSEEAAKALKQQREAEDALWPSRRADSSKKLTRALLRRGLLRPSLARTSSTELPPPPRLGQRSSSAPSSLETAAHISRVTTAEEQLEARAAPRPATPIPRGPPFVDGVFWEDAGLRSAHGARSLALKVADRCVFALLISRHDVVLQFSAVVLDDRAVQVFPGLLLLKGSRATTEALEALRLRCLTFAGGGCSPSALAKKRRMSSKLPGKLSLQLGGGGAHPVTLDAPGLDAELAGLEEETLDVVTMLSRSQARRALAETNYDVAKARSRLLKGSTAGEEVDEFAGCLICGTTEAPRRSLQCSHMVCVGCWSAYARDAANSGRPFVSCPALGCSSTATEGALALLAPKDVRRLARMARSAVVDRGSTMSWCPRPGCGFATKCRVAGFGTWCGCDGFAEPWCDDCGSADAHWPLSCEEHAKYLGLHSALAGVGLTAAFLSKHTRPCPKCRGRITKDGGCNHVRCSACNNYFCWLCGGEGQLCNAYSCNHPSIKEQDEDDSPDPLLREALAHLRVVEATKRLAKLRSLKEQQLPAPRLEAAMDAFRLARLGHLWCWRHHNARCAKLPPSAAASRRVVKLQAALEDCERCALIVASPGLGHITDDELGAQTAAYFKGGTAPLKPLQASVRTLLALLATVRDDDKPAPYHPKRSSKIVDDVLERRRLLGANGASPKRGWTDRDRALLLRTIRETLKRHKCAVDLAEDIAEALLDGDNVLEVLDEVAAMLLHGEEARTVIAEDLASSLLMSPGGKRFAPHSKPAELALRRERRRAMAR